MYAAEDQWTAALDRGGRVDFFGSKFDLQAQRRFGDIDSIRQYIDRVLNFPRIVAGYPDAGPVGLRERAGQRGAHYELATKTIAIPMGTQWAARESVILHEVAHHLTFSIDASADLHGATFRQVMCGLVEEILGAEAALLLRAGYEEAGLRTVASS